MKPGVDFIFPDMGTNDVRWKAKLKSFSHVLTPRLYQVAIDGDFVSPPIVESVVKSIKKLEKNKAVKLDNKSKKAFKNARKHLGKALNKFAESDFEGAQTQINKAISDLKKVKTKKSNAKKLVSKLKKAS